MGVVWMLLPTPQGSRWEWESFEYASSEQEQGQEEKCDTRAESDKSLIDLSNEINAL